MSNTVHQRLTTAPTNICMDVGDLWHTVDKFGGDVCTWLWNTLKYTCINSNTVQFYVFTLTFTKVLVHNIVFTNLIIPQCNAYST